MTLKYVFPLLALTATSVTAEEYQLFSLLSLDHYRSEVTYQVDDIIMDRQYSSNIWQLGGSYFFAPKKTLGPLDQFEFINKVNNVSAHAIETRGGNGWGVGGEYFIDNGISVSARHSQFDGDYENQLGLGYFVTNNLKVNVEASKAENASTEYMFSAQYNYQLQGADYVGFNAFTDDEADYYGVSSKYFASLGADRYLVAGVTLAKADESYWALSGSYYFNKMTSVGVNFDKEDNYAVTAKHFFNTNWAVEARYASNSDDSSDKLYHVSVIGQF